MAHLQDHHHQPAAIFSPSVARIAASTARDWSYVDSWLASKLPPDRPIPAFERNQDTLKALLALALANEAADDERNHRARASELALRTLRRRQQQHKHDVPSLRGDLLASVQRELPQDGKDALDALANLAVHSGAPLAAPQDLAHGFVRLQAELSETELIMSRLDLLRRHVDREAGLAADALHAWQSDRFKPLPDAARQNLDLQRKTKAMHAQLVDLRDRAPVAAQISHLTAGDAAREEQDLLDLLACSEKLEERINAFGRLPCDAGEAKAEIDSLRSQLHHLSLQLDAIS
ncbi:hypothetical protein L249_7469 [Ophiocordyceps polyrhachis-furcata BCC 54312]|uniref:Uncharacterized protein n=1 Tax=Ophiocordyceps polyrhachis-furcata BCC 54312 TaxID=1330021 RepID=A0A367LAA4_9HYPO|nr:hypothetical protein L249_7469 [Ophiocordyceps polyrhachis-furcata BCC 54312]